MTGVPELLGEIVFVSNLGRGRVKLCECSLYVCVVYVYVQTLMYAHTCTHHLTSHTYVSCITELTFRAPLQQE